MLELNCICMLLIYGANTMVHQALTEYKAKFDFGDKNSFLVKFLI